MTLLSKPPAALRKSTAKGNRTNFRFSARVRSHWASAGGKVPLCKLRTRDMAQWISDNVTEVAILGSWSNARPIVTVLQVKRSEDDPAASGRDVLNNWQDHIVGWQCNNYVLTGARFTDHNEAVGATGFLAPNVAKPVAGADSGNSAPPAIAVLVKKGINSHVGRRAGRMYLPPQPEVNVDENGVMAGAVVTSINANLALFLAGLDSGNVLGVVHKLPVGDAEFSAVTSLIVDPLVATQRRRNRR